MSGKTEDVGDAQAERVRTKPCKQGHDVAESWHDGTRWHCRGCHRSYSRRWAAKNPDKIKAKTKRDTEHRRAKREAERPTPEEEARRKLAERSTEPMGAELVRVKPCKQGHDPSASYHDGKRWQCRACQRAWARRWRDANPDAHKRHSQRYGARERAKRETPLTPDQRREAVALLAQHSTRDAETGCLTWDRTGLEGYGHLNFRGRRLAHRLAWEVRHGPIPEGLVIDHLCHNRGCIEVEHLRVVTREQNNRNVRPGGRLGEVWDKLSPNPYSTTWIS